MGKGIFTSVPQQILDIKNDINNASNVIYDAESDTLKVLIGSQWVSVYACGISSAALIPVMTSNASPKNNVATSDGNANAYKSFGSLPVESSNGGYEMSGYQVAENTTLTYTYTFDNPVNISKIDLIPYGHILLNYVIYNAVTYTVSFVHEDDTKTTAATYITPAKGYGSSSAVPTEAKSLHTFDIEKDNVNIKAIEINVSGPIVNYDSGKTYYTGLNYFQAYGTVAQ